MELKDAGDWFAVAAAWDEEIIRLREVLSQIQKRAAPGHRTFDEALSDLLWISDEARRALGQGEKSPAGRDGVEVVKGWP